MSYEQYTQMKKQILEMPYEQKIQLLSIITDSLKNAEESKAVNFQIQKPNRQFGILKGKIWMAPDFDKTPPGFEEYM